MLLPAILSVLFIPPIPAAAQADAQAAPSAAQRVQVRMVTDEPEAVLAILSKLGAKTEAKTADTPDAAPAASAEITDADWQKLFSSEGYRRLKKREAAMKRAFTDDDFKKFVLSPELLAKAERLQETLDSWKQADVTVPAELALAYLPESATIRATIYPSIKPHDNSFVFEVATDPAIFLYLDPEVTREEFENTLAHELHHIGYGTACPPKEVAADTAKQPAPAQMLRKWVSAFGEGFAMLAAAGGPDVHPRATASQEKHEKWDMDMGRFYQNRIELDSFFMSVLKGELTGDKADAQAFTYFGYQGPWYTVGYRMATTVEAAFGRQRLIDSMCDGSVLAAYNEAIEEQLKSMPVGQARGKPTWSPEIVKALETAKPAESQPQ
ncbi:MAG: hypothetical protein LAO20_11125 [Acidobacteriia bacterium]|nr:hypothetical protein [Terriglobia bacterium]